MALWTEPCGGGGGGGGRRRLEEGYLGAEAGRWGYTDGSGGWSEKRLQHMPKTDAAGVKDETAGEKSWSQAASGAQCLHLEQRKVGCLHWGPDSGSGLVVEAPEMWSWTGFGGSGMQPESLQNL